MKKGPRLLAIRMMQAFTGVIQLKGVPKGIGLIKKSLFKRNQVYETYHNIRLMIDPAVNFHCLNIVHYGGYEAVRIFETFLKPGDVYVDVGTNLGYMSLNAEKIVGNTGKVISFEPDAEILPLLKANLALNQSKIILVEKAVSDHKGTAAFNIATETGLSRLENVNQNLAGLELFRKSEVPIDTLDHVLADLIPGRPLRMLKIDVEGHELKILHGGKETIRNFRPVIFMEINHGALKENKVTYKDILQFLADYNYDFFYIESHSADWFRIGRQPTLKPLYRFSEDFLANLGFDLLCVPKT